MRKHVLLSAHSRRRPNGEPSAKDYPYWQQVIARLKMDDIWVTQVFQMGEKVFNGLKGFWSPSKLAEIELAFSGSSKIYDTWMSVDSFLPHLMWRYRIPGVVVWGKSDPKHFGYTENINLFKDRRHFRPNQFYHWHDEPLDPEVFPDAETVATAVRLSLFPPLK